MRSRPATTSSLVALAFGVPLDWHRNANTNPAPRAGQRQDDPRHEMGAGDVQPGQGRVEQTFQEHVQITESMNALAVAWRAAQDKAAQEFAEAAVGDPLYDRELPELMAIAIGDYLRTKLPAGQ